MKLSAAVGLALLVLVVGCDRRPVSVVASGQECTSIYDDKSSPKRVCGADDSCLLMTLPGEYRCRRRCKVDGDCKALGPDAKCVHAQSHGDDFGCFAGRDGGR